MISYIYSFLLRESFICREKIPGVNLEMKRYLGGGLSVGHIVTLKDGASSNLVEAAILLSLLVTGEVFYCSPHSLGAPVIQP